MSNVQVKVSQLKPGMMLADRRLVSNVITGYGWTVEFALQGKQHYREDQYVELYATTNCLYGGARAGHSSGFCTADSCF